MDIPSPASTCTLGEEVLEMTAGPPTARFNDEGIMDHVLDILNAHSHPVILVGLVAQRWMGCASSVDAGFDLVLRKCQLPTIATSIVETGFWTIFDSPKAFEVSKSKSRARKYPKDAEERKLLEYLCEADAVLKWEGIEGIGFSYMRLWTDETYHIDIDATPLVEVPELYPWNLFLAENEFHPALRRDDGWFYGPRTLDDAITEEPTEPFINASPDGGCHIFGTIYRRAKGARNTTPINIISIPAYLGVLVYHTTHYSTSKPKLAYVASRQIENLTQYLYLELPHQKNALLFQVEAETENYLQPYLEKWKRNPQYVMLHSRELVLVNTWEPWSYPEDVYFPPPGWHEWKRRMSRNQPQVSGFSAGAALN